MKAISLWQPWASAIAFGSKRIETRSWKTSYRGPLAIHAAKRCVKGDLIHLAAYWGWTGAMWPVVRRDWYRVLPFGAIVAICQLIDCRPTGSFTQEELDQRKYPPAFIVIEDAKDLYGWSERLLGDFSLGRYGWVLDDVRPVDSPIPFKGKQGFFDVPDELLNE